MQALGFATHNRAGEITYKRIEPMTQIVGGVPAPIYRYLITVTIYTDDGTTSSPSNSIADRCIDTIYFGDGTHDAVERMNGGTPLCAGCYGCGCAHCGELVIDEPGYRVKVNTYTVTHTYSSAGYYRIRTSDPNRNDGVRNMAFSGQQYFYIESWLRINNFSGANSSPQFNNPPTDKACLGKCFYHNPAAYDADGDRLTYELSVPRSENGQPVQGYFQPEIPSGGLFEIDSLTGTLTWCTPLFNAEYNVAFIVREWRKNTSGAYVEIGSVLRDMQIIVMPCNNNPPLAQVPQDTCVEAGTFLHKSIQVTDVVLPPRDPATNTVFIEGKGGAFSSPLPNATLSPNSGISPYSAQFDWQTTCEHVRLQPYKTVFKVKDQDPQLPLPNFSTYSIRVLPPSVKNVAAVQEGASIKLSWDASTCSPANNPLLGYRIYRKNGCGPFQYDPCTPGSLPGFVLLGKTPPTTLVFTDSNNGNGLVVGQDYSYLVTAFYKDSSESYAGQPLCAKLKRNIPVLLNVDVRATSASSGQVYVRWARPVISPQHLDTIAFAGPYQFILKYRQGASGNFVPVYTSASPYFLGLDTIYLHSLVNTVDDPAWYTVEFIAGPHSIGSSPLASSIFLSATGSDRRIQLQWTATTPWNNHSYTILRKDPSASAYAAIGTTTLTHYNDSGNIVNRYSYCYKVLADGSYTDPTIFKPLLNHSQEACAMARDLTPPCPPSLSLESNCANGFVRVKWNSRQNLCSDDVVKHILYYKTTPEDNYALVHEFDNSVTSYDYDGLTLISGCYAMKSVDSSGNVSTMSVDFCLDNCPEFELPNIFSPNGDNANDVFKAIKVRQVKEIDLVVFDRWGNEVYRTRDPYFEWNGLSQATKKPVSEGTLFYVCEVFEPRLTGIRKRGLKGYVQLVR